MNMPRLEAVTGKEVIDYVLYDTLSMGTTAKAKKSFFQQTEASATNGLQDTNMSQAGSLVATEDFEIDRIAVIVSGNPSSDDVDKTLGGSVLELKIADKRAFVSPTVLLASPGAVQGSSATTASSTTLEMIGIVGEGISFKEPIIIPGGTKFSVDVYAGTTAASSAVTLVVALIGKLRRPVT
jgi:hypothetical protein